MHATTPSSRFADAAIAREVALLVVRHDGLISPGRRAGSLLACGEIAWRYEGETLTEVPWADYERCVGSPDRSDWPPNAVRLSLQPGPDPQTLIAHIDITYDIGISEDTRGGESAICTLRHDGNAWQIAGVDVSIFSD